MKRVNEVIVVRKNGRHRGRKEKRPDKKKES